MIDSYFQFHFFKLHVFTGGFYFSIFEFLHLRGGSGLEIFIFEIHGRKLRIKLWEYDPPYCHSDDDGFDFNPEHLTPPTPKPPA